eukprot:6642037-Prymnesium_polylepis.1
MISGRLGLPLLVLSNRPGRLVHERHPRLLLLWQRLSREPPTAGSFTADSESFGRRSDSLCRG